MVISIRVPEELKREMDRLRDEVNWSEEIREFIKRRIEEYRKKEIFNELLEYIKTLPEAPKGIAHELVRESRESRWLFSLYKILSKGRALGEVNPVS